MKNPFARPAAVARHLKIAVTGKSGTGKTVFGLAARKHGLGRVAVVSNEAGDVHYIQHPEWGGFDRLPTQRIEELEDAIGYIEAHPGEYGTLVLDTVTGVYEALVGAKAKDDGSVNVKAWGLIKRKWRSIMARVNNLPLNVVAVVHENDIVEQDANGGSRVVGQKLDAEKTFERNPDVLIRLGVVDGKRVARVLKDRTGTFQAGEIVPEPHLGLWAKAIKTGAAEARVSLPEEIDAANEAAIGAGTAAHHDAPTTADTRSPVEIAAALCARCTEGFAAKPHRDNWVKKHRAELDALPDDLKEQVRVALRNAPMISRDGAKAAPAA